MVAVFHQGFENLEGVSERGRVNMQWTYHKGTVFLMVVAMFDLLADGPGCFGWPMVGAISRWTERGAIRKYPVDCRVIDVASSGMLLGRRSAVQGWVVWGHVPVIGFVGVGR